MNGDLKSEIRKLTKVMEQNTLLDYELSGYMSDSVRRKIFRDTAKVRARDRRKYIAIDQDTSGKFLVQKKADKIAGEGYVWGIKAYGQRGRPVGRIADVIKKYENGNASLKEAVMERALKKRFEGGAK